jgi:hypothetical protein
LLHNFCILTITHLIVGCDVQTEKNRRPANSIVKTWSSGLPWQDCEAVSARACECRAFVPRKFLVPQPMLGRDQEVYSDNHVTCNVA